MGITKIDGSEVIKLKGFNIDGEILLSDSDSMDNYEKVDVLLPKDYLEFLITDRGILDNLNIETTVW